jgi:hypothetical protein
MLYNIYPTTPADIYHAESLCDFIESVYDDIGHKLAMQNDPDGVEEYFSDTMIEKL